MKIDLPSINNPVGPTMITHYMKQQYPCYDTTTWDYLYRIHSEDISRRFQKVVIFEEIFIDYDEHDDLPHLIIDTDKRGRGGRLPWSNETSYSRMAVIARQLDSPLCCYQG